MEFPIAVFAYNRPKHLRACLEAIQVSQEYGGFSFPVYIYCDAPKKKEDEKRVFETVSVAEAWECKKKVIIRERNHGFHNIVEGVTETCGRFGQAIVVEDDILVAPDFLTFMHRGLKQYASDEQVFGITGYMYFNANPPKPETFFQPYSFCWGWATWKRAWQFFEWVPKNWEAYLKNKKNRYYYNCYGMFPFAKMAEKSIKGVWDAWDPQWGLCVFKKKGLFLTPYRSLVWNCGCGGGTHGDRSRDEDIALGERENYIHGNMKLEDFKKQRLSTQFSLPGKVACDNKAVRLLGVALLKERILREPRKRIRLWLKLVFHSVMVFFTPRP